MSKKKDKDLKEKKKRTSKKGRATTRAQGTKDAYRLLYENVPVIRDETILITPAIAEKMLEQNGNNRPYSWPKIDRYVKLMESGKWVFHPQGIIIDCNGVIVTGQSRLMAIVISGMSVPMRVSRGVSPDVAPFIDRGTPQSARDIAGRITGRRHPPMDQSIARALCVLRGNIKPDTDEVAAVIVEFDKILELCWKQTRRIRKTKGMYMILAAICSVHKINSPKLEPIFGRIEIITRELDQELAPAETDHCWNRSAAFSLAMAAAMSVVKKRSK